LPESFLRLPASDRSEILRYKARELGRRPLVLEKDIWVCWSLHQLFSMQDMPRMAFKGGTSLSKVFDAIHRFSEDVDVTFDYRDVRGGLGFDDDPEGMSGERLKRFRKALEGETSILVRTKVVPRLYEALTREFGGEAVVPEVDEAGEKVKVFFPTALEQDAYIREAVLLEFGGRNLTDPCSVHTIKADIAESLEGLEFPEATVSVLAPERTFWEKATLIHAECSRGALRDFAERPSRHWYDLANLSDHAIGQRALADRDLFESVVAHKKWAFRDQKAKYDRCLNGGLRLMPDNEAMQRAIEADFEAMVSARMFYENPPPFSEIADRLERLAAAVNAAMKREGAH